MANPPSDVQIANMALMRVGVTQTLVSAAGGQFTDQSATAQIMNVWYWQDRDAELTEYPWPWASKYVPLAQVSAQQIPANPEWGVSYRYPTDCLAVRRIVCGRVVTNAVPVPPQTTANPPVVPFVPAYYRADGDAYPWPFEIGSDVLGRLVYTNAANAWIKYTYGVTDPTQYASDFADLLAWRVAVDVGFALARDDKRRDLCIKMYEQRKMEVRSRFMNEDQNSQPFIDYNSETIRARQIG